MSEVDRDDLQAAWRQLSRRYDWALVADEARFLDEAAADLAATAADKAPKERARIAVWCAYSALLYRGLWRRDERAAQELWTAIARMALKRGYAQPEAEELAQETIARLLEKLPGMHRPQGALSYAFLTLRTVQREQSKQMRADQPLQNDSDEATHEPADPADLAQAVEERLIGAELHTLLLASLTNELERTTLTRTILLGEHPRDVAREIGLPLHRTRVAKHRALERLRGDETFMARLRTLVGAGDPGAASAEEGGDDTIAN